MLRPALWHHLLLYALQNQKQKNYTNLHHWWAEVDRVRDVPHYPTLLRNELISYFDNLQLESVKYFDYDFPAEDDTDDYEDLEKEDINACLMFA